ncbi:MAG: hypothetical protein EPN85_05515 [Bacteroidetes bacterium]|nr:MAG: hypothetical protein EPN85_05515 [Bacteroidota bacterium]
MKKFPHQQFIGDNQVNIETLPEMLQKRIKGFDELQEDLQHTTDEDNERLMGKLETLSHELAEDMEEHFEEHLENNDREEDEPEVLPEPIQEEKAEEPAPEPIQEEPAPIQEQEPEPVHEPTDEEILAALLAGNKELVLPSELKEKGFKTDLNGRKLLVGRFCLNRGKYDTCYQIILKSE